MHNVAFTKCTGSYWLAEVNRSNLIFTWTSVNLNIQCLSRSNVSTNFTLMYYDFSRRLSVLMEVYTLIHTHWGIHSREFIKEALKSNKKRVLCQMYYINDKWCLSTWYQLKEMENSGVVSGCCTWGEMFKWYPLSAKPKQSQVGSRIYHLWVPWRELFIF